MYLIEIIDIDEHPVQEKKETIYESNDDTKIVGENDSKNNEISLSDEIEKLSRHTENLNRLLSIVKANHESISMEKGNEEQKNTNEDEPTFSQNSSETPILEWPPNSTVSEASILILFYVLNYYLMLQLF